MAEQTFPSPDLTLFEKGDLSRDTAEKILGDALHNADDGELFLEYAQSESLGFDNNRLKSASFNTDQGFGLRAVAGEAAGYAHSGEISIASLKRASNAVQAVQTGYSGTYANPPQRTNQQLYTHDNPIGAPTFEEKVALLQEINTYARDKGDHIRQVSAALSASYQVVEILRVDGHYVRDIRPMTRLNISIVAGKGNKQESGSFGMGGRTGFHDFIKTENWQNGVEEALRQALINLEAIPAPAGEFDVVLGAGWPGILIHEAVGHGLEGDFNRKKTSAFSGLMGEMVASKGVTIVDDGTLQNRRGSLSIDDEGTPSQCTPLIEDGRLVGYMQDRQNARLMGVQTTGNGRRQSYAHIPMPRMTNTIMMNGNHAPDEIISSVKNGLYAVSFGGGQVDITSGKFVFECTEAYLLENGKIGAPVKGAMIIGNGPDAMRRVPMVGHDMKLDPGIGTCGKQGQGVPVGVGQPTIRIDAITVGGTTL